MSSLRCSECGASFLTPCGCSEEAAAVARLRDEFAMAALTGVLSEPAASHRHAQIFGIVPEDETPAEGAARVAYIYADAMLAERGDDDDE